jgi:hypothetical protein
LVTPDQLSWLADALETSAIVLAERNPGRAAATLSASDRLREAAKETRGGARVITEQVRQAHDRLITALGADRFALHENENRELALNETVALVRAGLEACRPDTDHP